MRYPYAPGAPRQDLYALLFAHAVRTSQSHQQTCVAPCIALLRSTEPEPFNEYGTLIPYLPGAEQAAADDADRILRNHRRMAHRAWTREIAAEHARGSEAAAGRAWMCARRYLNLPTIEA